MQRAGQRRSRLRYQGQRAIPFPMFRAPDEDQTRAASSPGTMQNIRRPGHAKSRPQAHRSYTRGQPQARGSGMAVHAPRAAGRPPQRPPPAERQPHAVPPRVPHRGRRDHTTPAAPGPPVPGNPSACPGATPVSRSGRKPSVTLLAHRAAAVLASLSERPAQRRTRSQNGHPADPVRGRPWKSRRCAPTVLAARTSSAMRPWTPRRIDPQCDTRRDKKETAPRVRFRSQGAVFAGGGRCWVRTNVG
jgi:hypothetical protein